MTDGQIYLVLLIALPLGSKQRQACQGVLCELRNRIAIERSVNPEDIQNEYEAKWMEAIK